MFFQSARILSFKSWDCDSDLCCISRTSTYHCYAKLHVEGTKRKGKITKQAKQARQQGRKAGRQEGIHPRGSEVVLPGNVYPRLGDHKKVQVPLRVGHRA